MKSKGRPTKSLVRENIIDILFQLKNATGYTISKVYNSVFPKVTVRLIYYHLKKGVSLGIFKISEIKKEEGDFSWGHNVEKIYYELTDLSNPRINSEIKKFIESNNEKLV